MKKRKIVFAFLIFLVLVMLLSNNVIAGRSSTTTNKTMVTDPRDNPSVYEPGTMSQADKVSEIGNRIIGIVQFVGSFASVIVLIVLGIKYMTGSVEEKAEYKKTMVNYIIKAVLVFAITNILGIINSITNGLV